MILRAFLAASIVLAGGPALAAPTARPSLFERLTLPVKPAVPAKPTLPVKRGLPARPAPPMTFYVAKGSPDSCGPGCDRWIAVEGQVDGKIELRDHVLTVGANGRIKAQVSAKAIVVFGQVTGNLTASEKVDIKENGSVDGDIVAPRVAIADGSHFRGSIDMQRKEQSSSKQPSSVERTLGAFSKPEPKPSMPPATSVTNDLIRV